MNIALPVLGMIGGATPPLILASFNEGSSEDEILWAMWSAMCCYVYVGCRKMAPNFPVANRWFTDTTAGVSTLMFLCTLTATSLAVLYAVLPVSFWMKVGVGVLLAIHAFYLAFLSHFYKEKTDGN